MIEKLGYLISLSRSAAPLAKEPLLLLLLQTFLLLLLLLLLRRPHVSPVFAG